MCPQYTDALAVGYVTIKLQNSTMYKCLNLNLTGSHTYIRMYIHTYICTDRRTSIRTYPRMHLRKIEKLYAPGIVQCGGQGVGGGVGGGIKIKNRTVKLYKRYHLLANMIHKFWHNIIHPKYLDRQAWANSEDSFLIMVYTVCHPSSSCRHINR